MGPHFTDSIWWSWVVLPGLIFMSRILDQSVGTLRLIFVAKGYRHIAPVLGFFEVTIWLLAVAQVFRHLTNPLAFVAYGAGFAAGNYIGIRIEEWLSLGDVVVRIIPRQSVSELIQQLRTSGCGVTVVDAEGATGRVQIIFTIVRRKALPVVIETLDRHSPNAFYTVEEVKEVREGYFGMHHRPTAQPRSWLARPGPLPRSPSEAPPQPPSVRAAS